MPTESYCVGGVNGSTGDYLLKQNVSPQQILEWARLDAAAWFQQEEPDIHHEELQRRKQRDDNENYALAPGLDPLDLAQTGWGVIFAQDAPPAVAEALQPLLKHRQAQAKERYFCFAGKQGHLFPGQQKHAFLGAHGATSGDPANPASGIPYYLLIVGDPARIPFRFQYELDVEYAVGRLCFDRLEDYDRYARSVVEAETRKEKSPRKVVLFGVRNADDSATELSSRLLVDPLRSALAAKFDDGAIERVDPGQATKKALTQILTERPPALLFTASHGMGFAQDDVRLRDHQGALLTADWPGPHAWRQPIGPEFYFAGGDVPASAQLTGTMAFFFACYGAGTPGENEFPHEDAMLPTDSAPRQPFVAALPQRLLAHAGGGMLAVVGHVERAWGCSFQGGKNAARIGVFEAALGQLLQGLPVGVAMEWFNQRYAALATLLTSKLMPFVLFHTKLREEALLETASLWTEHNDARSYVILGDPAVRLQM